MPCGPAFAISHRIERVEAQRIGEIQAVDEPPGPVLDIQPRPQIDAPRRQDIVGNEAPDLLKRRFGDGIGRERLTLGVAQQHRPAPAEVEKES